MSINTRQILNNGSSENYITITSSGNIGIGNTSPTNKLDIAGDLKITNGSLIATHNSNTIGSLITTAGNIGIGTTNLIERLNVNGNMLIGSNFSYTSNLIPSSDGKINGINITSLNKRTRTSKASAIDCISKWSLVTSGMNRTGSGICWSSELGIFVMVSDEAGGVAPISTSPDGITWTTRSVVDNAWRSVCWSPELSLFVAVAASGTGNRIITSPNGIDWTIRSSPSDNNWRIVTWSAELGIFVAVSPSGNNDRVMTSSDGINWSLRTTNNNNWNSVCWSPELNLFVAVAGSGSSNRAMTSSDGINWTTQVTPNNEWHSVTWSAELGLFVAVAVNSTSNNIMRSSDGKTWILSETPVLLHSICWSPELSMFLCGVFDTSARIVISFDGINWTIRSGPPLSALAAIAWSPELSTFILTSRVLGVASSAKSWIGMPNSKSVLKASPSHINVSETGNIGIGTTAPGYTLDVNGTLDVSNSNGLMLFNSAGNLGIGTTAPSQKLHIRTMSNNLIRIETNNNAIGEISGIEFGIPIFDSNTRSKITSTTFGGDGSDLKFHTASGTTRSSVIMTLASSGNVGIGTTAPGAKLDIYSTSTWATEQTIINTSGSWRFSVAGSTNTENPRGSFNLWDVSSGLGSCRLTINSQGNFGIGTTAPGAKLDISGSLRITGGELLATHNSNTLGSLITTDGNIGIGTTAPSSNLHVIGTGIFSPSSTNNSGITISPSNTSYASSALFINTTRSSSNQFSLIDARSNGISRFFVRGDGIVFINGDVGIGTNNPGYKLDVQGGDINASGNVRSNGTALFSDQRVKENIIDADTVDNLSHILSLELKHYDYTQAFIDHTGLQDTSNYGFIAQQVKEIIPNAVDIQHITLQKDVITQVPVLDEEGNPKLNEQGNEVTVEKHERIVIQDIHDFHFLKKDLIFTEAIGAIQELYKQLQEEKQLNAELRLFIKSKFPGEI